MADFIQAKSSKEILFTRGTTTSLNWVAQFAKEILQPDQEVIISVQEHHSNIIPWQQACQQIGAKLRYVPLKDGELDVDSFKSMLSEKTKFVSLAHVSNVLGSVAPIGEIAELVHEVGAYLVVDGAQSVPHMAVNVQELDMDFYAFSGHKMLGPTGIGVLYGKEELLNLMSPVEFGGEMIDFVYEQSATWKELPWKFEAGTPNIAGAIGLGAAVDYLTEIGMDAIQAHEAELVDYVFPKLQAIPGLTIYGSQDLSSGRELLPLTWTTCIHTMWQLLWTMKVLLCGLATIVPNRFSDICRCLLLYEQVFTSTIPRLTVISWSRQSSRQRSFSMALSRLDSLYMAVVSEHSKSPRHRGSLDGVEKLELHNPTCGDVIELSVKIEKDVITDIAFDGVGCTISTASASMMTEAVLGKEISQIQELAEIFSQMVQGQEDPRQKELGDASLLAGVAKFPQRIKCATLPWNALKKALERSDSAE